MIELALDDDVRLRPLRGTDVPAMCALLESDRAHFDRWLRWTPGLESEIDVARFVADFEALEARREGFHLGLFVEGALAGGVVCWTIHPRHRSSEVGYWLGTRQLGRGLATRAAGAVVTRLFADCDVHRIEMLCAFANVRSRAVPERLGFALESVRRGSHRIGDEFRDHVVYARLVTDPPPRLRIGPLLAASEFDALLARLADAWTRRDYAAAVREFAADVQYADPTRYTLDGRPALRAFFGHDDDQAQRVTWHTAVFDTAQQVGAAEYTYEGTHRYHGTVLVRVVGGVITHWREYQHVDARAWEEFVGGTRFP